MDIISCGEAKKHGLKYYFTGKFCKCGHVAQRTVSSGTCVECRKEYNKQRFENNKTDILSKQREYYKRTKEDRKKYEKMRNVRDRDKRKAARLRYYYENRDKLIARAKKSRENNIDEVRRKNKEACARYREANRDKRRKICLEWNKNHREYCYALGSKRRAIKLKRTIFKDDLVNIKAIYAEAVKRRKMGEDVHVDHIIALQAKLVSGLHCSWNLQIISAHDNLVKHNKFDIEEYNG